MRRSLTEWIAIAACIAFGSAVARRAAAMDLPRLATEASQYRGGLPSPETADRQMDLAREYGFFRDLDESAATPRIAWGKPLAGGPVRALILHSWFAGREVVELAQRLDLKCTHVALLREQDWPPLDRHGSNLFEPLEKRLLESLKGDEPVIAFSSSPCPWTDLRAPTRKALLEAVQSGKGLVYAGDPAPVAQEMGRDFTADPQAAQVLLNGIPPNLRGAAVRAGQFGKGRVVFLGFPAEAAKNSLLFSPTGGGLATLNDPQREAACSLLAQSLLWASRRATGVSVSLPENLTLKSERMPEGPVLAGISGPGVQWMDWYVQPAGDAPPVSEGREYFKEPGTQAELNLPHLPAGQYILHAIARDADRASLAWTSAALTITCDSGLKVEFNQPQYGPGDSASVTVEVTKAAGHEPSLQCSLTDASGRLMATETRALAAGSGAETMRFTFPMNLAVAKTALARATLFEGDRALVRAEAAALVARSETRNGAQNFLYYIAGGDCFREAAEQIGMPAMIGPGPLAARLDLESWRRDAMPELEITQTVPLDQLVRKPCLAEAGYLERSQDWIRGQAQSMALTGELGLFVADAWNYAGRGAVVTNLSHSPASEQAFRDQARAEFSTLDRLNSEWGTRYANWDKVVAPLWEQACQSGKFSDWIDKRRSDESVVAEFFKKCAAAGKEVYPGFRLALSGTLNPSDVAGYDWWKLMGAVDAVSLGDGPQVQLARSFARPGQLLMRAVADSAPGAEPGRCAREIWDALFCGLNGVMDSTAAANSPLFWPDLSLRPNGMAVARAVRALRAGPADLVAGATREDDGVAILYSQPSLHAAAAEGARGRPVGEETYVQSLAGCEALLGDLGLQFRYIAGDEVAADALRKRGCRLLVVPFSQAISPEEIGKIRSFLMAGGALLADLCPGVTDAHGKAYDFSQMDELLGLKRQYHRPLYRPGRLVVQPQSEYLLPAMEFNAVLGEPSLRLNGAVAWATFEGEGGARAPAATFHRIGAGLSMLLNFSLAGYRAAEGPVSSDTQVGRAEATQKLVRTFLAAGRIQPAISLRAEPPAGSAFCARFRSGEAVYLGLSAPPGGSRNVFISLNGLVPAKRFVYDVLAHKYLGRTQSFDYTMKESYGELLALMPREIGKVRLSAPQRADRGRPAPVSVTLSDWKADLGRTVFRIGVYGPDGSLSAAYTRTIACDGGRAETVIPLALNDAPGEWLIRATEVVSGHSDEARVTVGGG
ncbi:MAG: beta-galactosidase trimerization domain-containing protein [Candidatus Brocadiia bacterium]|jgi:hypothetical protein